MAKFKISYTVYLGEKQIGYIENINQFEDRLEKELYNNEQENIAFSDFNEKISYEFKLIDKNKESEQEQVLIQVKENADKTYFKYAINVNEEEKKYVKTQEEANQIIEELQKQLDKENNIAVTKVYTKNLDIEESVEVASKTEEIISQIKEEKKKEEATINGIYLAVNPISGHITSRYGAREDIRDHTHQGLDIAAKTGTPIKAVADGTITHSGTMGGYGNLIIIDHGNGITSYYGHCNKLYKKVGAKVSAGDIIAEVGSTGNSTGPHLHFEIRQNGKYVNPQKYLYK